MSHTFKSGPAMVEIESFVKEWAIVVCPELDKWQTISTDYLRPFPPVLTPEGAAVIEAARRCRRSRSETAFDALYGAVDALEASLPPPDPVAALVAAIRADDHAMTHYADLVDAVEKKRKA